MPCPVTIVTHPGLSETSWSELEFFHMSSDRVADTSNFRRVGKGMGRESLDPKFFAHTCLKHKWLKIFDHLKAYVRPLLTFFFLIKHITFHFKYMERLVQGWKTHRLKTVRCHLPALVGSVTCSRSLITASNLEAARYITLFVITFQSRQFCPSSNPTTWEMWSQSGSTKTLSLREAPT